MNENFARESRFEKISIHKVNLENKHETMIYDPCDTKKLSLKIMENTETYDEPMTNPYDRQKYLIENTDLSGLNESQMNKMKEIFLECSEAFFIPNDIFKPTSIYKHSIKLKPDADTEYVKQFRIPFARRDELRRQVENWEKNGIIEKSVSRFNSPLLLVPKKPDEHMFSPMGIPNTVLYLITGRSIKFAYHRCTHCPCLMNYSIFFTIALYTV